MTTAHHLTQAEARRVAVRAQLLDRERPAGLVDMVHDLTLLQLDPTAAVAPSADLVAWSRLGSAYTPSDLTAALADRRLIDLHGLIRPAEDLALFRAEMAQWPGRGEVTAWRLAQADWVRANDTCRRDVLARLEAGGPQLARELPDLCDVPWKSSGWNDNRNVGQLLDLMVSRGEVAVSGRRNGERLWDLAERVYPDLPEIPADEARTRRDERRLQSLGIARARTAATQFEPLGVGEAGEPAVIEGVRGAWRVDPHQLDAEFEGRTVLLSPLDRLLYDRKRMIELFGFDYQLEMYKPAGQRRWGYWALPILQGDRLAGKVDAVADRKAGVLKINAVHEDEPLDDDKLDIEIDELADWLGLRLERGR